MGEIKLGANVSDHQSSNSGAAYCDTNEGESIGMFSPPKIMPATVSWEQVLQ
jgi:hypothetical protein